MPETILRCKRCKMARYLDGAQKTFPDPLHHHNVPFIPDRLEPWNTAEHVCCWCFSTLPWVLSFCFRFWSVFIFYGFALREVRLHNTVVLIYFISSVVMPCQLMQFSSWHLLSVVIFTQSHCRAQRLVSDARTVCSKTYSTTPLLARCNAAQAVTEYVIYTVYWGTCMWFAEIACKHKVFLKKNVVTVHLAEDGDHVHNDVKNIFKSRVLAQGFKC